MLNNVPVTFLGFRDPSFIQNQTNVVLSKKYIRKKFCYERPTISYQTRSTWHYKWKLFTSKNVENDDVHINRLAVPEVPDSGNFWSNTRRPSERECHQKTFFAQKQFFTGKTFYVRLSTQQDKVLLNLGLFILQNYEKKNY